MTDEDLPNIIPFGKHKGKTVEEIRIAEPGYLDWLEGQPWFRDKFVVLHQTIINRGAEPEETPDHNALQVLFLDNAFCMRVAKIAGCNLDQDFEKNKKWALKNPMRAGYPVSEIEQWKSDPGVSGRSFEVDGIDVVFSVSDTGLRDEKFAVEIKPQVGDDYPAVLRQINALTRPRMVYYDYKVLFLERYIGIGATVEQFKTIFKASRITVVFRHEVDQ